MGISSETISKYGVYSMETADEMSFNISKFANSSYGIGITGKLNRVDKNNLLGEDDDVFIDNNDDEEDEKEEDIFEESNEDDDLMEDDLKDFAVIDPDDEENDNLE